jgi:hypothetical protein
VHHRRSPELYGHAEPRTGHDTDRDRDGRPGLPPDAGRGRHLVGARGRKPRDHSSGSVGRPGDGGRALGDLAVPAWPVGSIDHVAGASSAPPRERRSEQRVRLGDCCRPAVGHRIGRRLDRPASARQAADPLASGLLRLSGPHSGGGHPDGVSRRSGRGGSGASWLFPGHARAGRARARRHRDRVSRHGRRSMP